ncbi:TAXI family TRAP transporter solute-binding subunit [Chloroflexota bacterium]
MINKRVYILFSILVTLGLLMTGFGCAKPVPAPAPTPAPAPAPKPAPAPAPAPKPEWKPPSVITFTGGSLTGSSFAQSSSFGDAVATNTGTLVRVQPGSGRGIPDAIRAGIANLAFTSSPTIWSVTHVGPRMLNNTDGWGPQRLRVLWQSKPIALAYAVPATSDIMTGGDLIGKKVVWFPESYPTGQWYVEALLTFFKLKKTDVKLITVPKASAGYAAFVDGSVDLAWASVTSSAARRFEAAPHGLRWLQLDPKDTEAWKQLREFIPFAGHVRETTGPATPVDTWGRPFLSVAYDWTDEELVYWLTKQKVVLYGEYSPRLSALEGWTLDAALDLTFGFLPFHPGAIRYYKEIGMWTDEHDTYQKEQLALEEKRIAEWKALYPDLKYDSSPLK